MTRIEDARAAVAHGATALGFICWPGSPRYARLEVVRAIVDGLPPEVTTVGVFVDEPIGRIREVVEASGLSAVQLHGDEPPDYATALGCPVLRSTSLDRAGETIRVWPAGTMLLVDAADPVRRGGTGRTIDWARAAEVARARRIVLAGGLTPENVAEAIATVRPFGVDVSSGVESSPGVKDEGRLARFLERARRAFDDGSAARPPVGAGRAGER